MTQPTSDPTVSQPHAISWDLRWSVTRSAQMSSATTCRAHQTHDLLNQSLHTHEALDAHVVPNGQAHRQHVGERKVAHVDTVNLVFAEHVGRLGQAVLSEERGDTVGVEGRRVDAGGGVEKCNDDVAGATGDGVPRMEQVAIEADDPAGVAVENLAFFPEEGAAPVVVLKRSESGHSKRSTALDCKTPIGIRHTFTWTLRKNTPLRGGGA